MKKHRWGKNQSIDSPYHPTQFCLKCGVFRQWLGLQFQTWEYTITVKYPEGVCGPATKETFVRPDCI